MHVDVVVIATSACVLSEEALSIGFIDCALKLDLFVPELAADINVSGLCSHTEANNESTFDELMRIVSQDFSVLASARLGLVTIDHKVIWPNYRHGD